MNVVFKTILFSVFLVNGIVSAQQYIELSGMLPEILTAEKPYIVLGDIFVPPGSLVTVEAGAVLMFENFTGLHVQGTIYVKGEQEKPVIFTSKNDNQFNPDAMVTAAPFDWNGIDIYETAIGSNFNHCILQFSVYGIRSQTEHFKLSNFVFNNNGKANVTIKGERQNIESDIPFSYGLAPVVPDNPLPQPQELTLIPETKPKIELVAEQTKTVKKTRIGIQILRYTSLAMAIGSGTASAWYYQKRYQKAQLVLEDLSVLDREEKINKSSKDWENAAQDRNAKIRLCIAGAGGAVVGVGIFTLSFAF
jgi:hypothetical protein